MKRFRPQVLVNGVRNFLETWTVSSHALFFLAIGGLFLQACNGAGFWNRTPPPVTLDDPASSDQMYTTPAVEPPGLPLSTEQRFEDVPVPKGAKPDLERTFVYQSASLHLGRLVYSSRASLTDLAQFYIREAPTGQWQLQDTIEADKGVILLFNKAGQRMVVDVKDLGLAKGRRLTVTVTPEGGAGGGV